MKKVDIRVIGKTEIDMNALTNVARENAEKLFNDYSQLLEYKNYLWKNNHMMENLSGEFWFTGINDKEIAITWNKLESIEYDLITLAKDYKSYRYSFRKIANKFFSIFNTRIYDVIMVGLWSYIFIYDCSVTRSLIGGICALYLAWYHANSFYKKNKEISLKKKGELLK